MNKRNSSSINESQETHGNYFNEHCEHLNPDEEIV